MQGVGIDLGYAHNFLVPSNGLTGGMAVFGINESASDFCRTRPSTTQICTYWNQEDLHFALRIYIYGNPNQQMRNKHWKRMIGLAEAGILSSKPRVALGDFNDIKSNEERNGGPKRAEYTFNTLRRMLNATGLHR